MCLKNLNHCPIWTKIFLFYPLREKLRRMKKEMSIKYLNPKFGCGQLSTIAADDEAIFDEHGIILRDDEVVFEKLYQYKTS